MLAPQVLKKWYEKRQQEVIPLDSPISARPKGTAPGSAGQSGDIQGLPDRQADSESVEELAEEGQPLRAEAIAAIEDTPYPDAEVRTKEVPEDDVPTEYDQQD
jgi:hypothetical protein